MTKFGNPTSVSKLLRPRKLGPIVDYKTYPVMGMKINEWARFKVEKVSSLSRPPYAESICIETSNDEHVGKRFPLVEGSFFMNIAARNRPVFNVAELVVGDIIRVEGTLGYPRIFKENQQDSAG